VELWKCGSEKTLIIHPQPHLLSICPYPTQHLNLSTTQHFGVSILIWCCESSMKVYPENLFVGLINQTPTENLKNIRMHIYRFNSETTRFPAPRYNQVRNKSTNNEVFQCQTEFKIGKIKG